ncbi:hypothetical protein SPFL3101_02828 [Sporomusaceae bacterium FL31]|nr:hypothetical protein SPFL3101_02828 [Sporomusaceae bacterium FL31]
MLAGAPAATAASCNNWVALNVHFTAEGCGEITIPLRDLIAMIDLYIAVDVGLVEGIIPISNPTGSAISMTLLTLSSLMTPMVCIDLIDS